MRSAVLLLLDESPRNGYQLIQEIEQRSSGAWRPSPGSIYPVLNQLEDEGLIAAGESTSGRTFTLSDAGKELVAQRRDALGTPWADAAAAVSEPRFELMRTTRQVAAAVRQVMEAGTEEQITSAAAILVEARRKIYRLLAEEENPT